MPNSLRFLPSRNLLMTHSPYLLPILALGILCLLNQERYQILTDKQHGFRFQHSCETQLVQTVHDLSLSLEKKQTDLIVMDLPMAFNTVPHQRLLRKRSHRGIVINIHSWLNKFLTTRKQRVVVGGENSHWVDVLSRVPQKIIAIFVLN